MTVRPAAAEQLDIPYWLTGCAIDDIKGEKLEEFDLARREFMRVFGGGRACCGG